MAPVAPLLSRYGHGSEDTTFALPVEINGQTNRAAIVRTIVARGQAVVTLRDVLAKLDVDPRYNSDVVRARIAAMFFPVLNMVRRQWYFKVACKFMPIAHSRRQCVMDGPSTLELLQVVMRLPMIKAACSLQEQRAILACFLHILKHTDFRYDHPSTAHTMHAAVGARLTVMDVSISKIADCRLQLVGGVAAQSPRNLPPAVGRLGAVPHGVPGRQRHPVESCAIVERALMSHS